MRDEIKNKLDEHIRQILDKPSISGEDYEMLKQRLAELPAETSNSNFWMYPLLMMLFAGFGGDRHGM